MARRRRRARSPAGASGLAAAIIGALLLFVETGAVAWAEQRVASGLTALLVASVPLFAALLDRTVFGVRLSLGALAGIATGLIGVALLVGPSAHIDPVGAAVLLAGAFAWAAGSAYARVAPLPTRAVPLHRDADALRRRAARGRRSRDGRARRRCIPRAVSAGSLGAFAYLIVIGSIGAYTAYGWLLQSGTPSVVVSTYAYVNPAIAVGLGWLFVGETVGGREIAAGAVILASVGMLVLAPRAARASCARA